MSTVWFITGSSRGLGKAIATYALENGNKVVATARKTDSIADLVKRYGDDRILALPLDVADYKACEVSAEKAIQKFGRVDILVNNAGYSDLASVEDMTVKAFRSQIDTNLYGVYNVCKAFLPALRKQGSGHIFQVSSLGDRISTPGLSAYQTAKWAVAGFSGVLAAEVQSLGIKVTTLEPGAMVTDWFGSSMDKPHPSEPYREVIDTSVQRIQGAMDNATTKVEKVAALIARIYKESDPPVRLLVGEDAATYGPMLSNLLKQSDEKWDEATRSVV
ncbi:hypothetical protein M409DRAFT_19277 [Zasmidium cellare ATCC 36951]|uniref:Uncharacterized protein n=1 Tax=Zasmidium cellare ATCC 36951 TaxID=1080233 RepID=A0A6A6CYJ2_ZASCE|nr:uncharacterized protein M409DRAFT_19277 [Zasmidium cellare ATCC 36951]KAF2170456.1 hypothetical protein M409DRAFT_19277 [Zasmidium cellare ATCC 36951]